MDRRRGWFRFRLSTALLLIPVAALIVYLNVRPSKYNLGHCYGWPIPVVSHQDIYGYQLWTFRRMPRAVLGATFVPWDAADGATLYVMADFAVGLAIIGSCGYLLERRRT